MVQGWVGQTVLEMDKAMRIVSISWEEIQQHRIKVWGSPGSSCMRAPLCSAGCELLPVMVRLQMAHLEAFLQEQTGVRDGLLSTTCTVRCNYRVIVCVARDARRCLCRVPVAAMCADTYLVPTTGAAVYREGWSCSWVCGP